MLRQLDKLVLKSFIGPFLVTFAIAMFVLLMQILWVYLDDIAGKGLGFFLIMELMAYKCVGLVPLALPLALLISSVMVMGGMAEHYELSSFKSAGVSLLRLMRPLIVFGVGCAVVSYLTNDYVIPASNLQFGARMYSIQSKKPTLTMEPGVFNDDFQNFAIRLGSKADNGRDITDVMIYDHSKATTGELTEIVAERGEMYSTPGGEAFAMRLYNGNQYVEQRARRGSQGGSLPFTRTSFGSYVKYFDLSEFNLDVYSENLFTQNRSMLATWQLQQGVDSIDLDLAIKKQTISNHVTSYLSLLDKDTVQYRPDPILRSGRDSATTLSDSLAAVENAARRANVTLSDGMPDRDRRLTAALSGAAFAAQTGRLSRSPRALPPTDTSNPEINRQRGVALDNSLVKATRPWQGLAGIVREMDNRMRKRVWDRARSAARSVAQQARNTDSILPGIRESRVKHVYDLHMKYSMALVCIIFVFIGAPMGAIVRKGGFGYPILVSVIFFVIFIILTIFCRKLAESFVVNGAFAGWLPCIVLFPVSLWITLRAMKDAKLINTDTFGQFFRSLIGRARARRAARATPPAA